MSDAGTTNDPALRVPLGQHDVLVISNRYETLSIINDVLIGVFFVIGSVLFYFEDLMTVATTMFVLGSVDFLLRPLIRLARRVHLRRLGQPDSGAPDY